MVTINPAECDRTTVYTGEFRNYSDTAWVPFQSGRRRAPDAPDYPWLVDFGTGLFWTRDTHVRNLVRLVPASEVTRAQKAERERDEARAEGRAAHDNWMNAADRAKAAERERDEVQERADQLRDERDNAVQACITLGRDRDEWRARAEAAEARTEPAVTRDEVWRVVAAHDPGDDEMALCRVNRLTDAVCRLFGVEAEPADPLLDKAQEFAALADWELTDREAGLLHTVAAHVLGQEDRHVDQRPPGPGNRPRRMGADVTDEVRTVSGDLLDPVRRILDHLANQTEPPCDPAVCVDAYRQAIHDISTYVYPEADQ